MRLVICIALLAVTLQAESISPRPTSHPLVGAHGRVGVITDRGPAVLPPVWKWSVVAMGAAQAADIVSTEMSRGVEANPLIPTRANGKPQYGFYAVKAGFAVGFTLIQRRIMKRHPDSKTARIFSGVNFGIASMTTAVSINNWRIR